MLTWAVMWMIVKCKDSEVAELTILFGLILGIGAIIVDGVILEILIKQAL